MLPWMTYSCLRTPSGIGILQSKFLPSVHLDAKVMWVFLESETIVCLSAFLKIAGLKFQEKCIASSVSIYYSSLQSVIPLDSIFCFPAIPAPFPCHPDLSILTFTPGPRGNRQSWRHLDEVTRSASRAPDNKPGQRDEREYLE
jgi:hypothetical protein